MCLVNDCNRIRKSLDEAQLTPAQLQKIHLICIEQELETLLLFDEQAISRHLENIKRRPCRVRRVPHPEYHVNPKNVLCKIFEDHGCRKYEDLKDAPKIIEFVDIKNLKNCPAFERFEKIINKF